MITLSEGVLSQEEIDALLRSDAVAKELNESAPAQITADEQSLESKIDQNGLSEIEKDAAGEVANIVMGSAATALSTLLGKKVEITTPVVQFTDPDRFRQEYPLPYLLVNVEYVTGISGANVLIIRDKDAGVMVDLMMGGDGQSPPEELGEIHLSAISEAMNQMMGSASTAMSTIIKERVEISPPTVEIVNFATDDLKGTIGKKGQSLVKVSFRMTIEGLVDSEIMQLIPVDFAKTMVRNLMDEMAASSSAHEEERKESLQDIPGLTEILREEKPVSHTPEAAAAAEPAGLNRYTVQVPEATASVQPAPVKPGVEGAEIAVKPATFAPLKTAYQTKEIANIDLIMDVPLQITVELGRSRKTIREILALTPGSVVELDKLAGEPVDLLVNGKLLAKGEVVVIDENFGIRVTDIISPIERVTSLQ